MKTRNALLLCLALALPAAAQDKPAAARGAETPRQPAGQRFIDLVICLDTSGSMDGLIDSARQKIWAIVNDLALARPAPRLRVALLSYGNNGHPESEGWVKVESDLTEDLDLISGKLFALRTNGGTELVARVIRRSLDKLAWQRHAGLKLIVVAGNESADQDTKLSFRDSCKAAIGRGIMINSIYCAFGKDGPDVAQGWKEIALLADGHYAAIDQDRGTVQIKTPFDKQLDDLSAAVNGTYVPWGPQGEVGRKRQLAADRDARNANQGTSAGRARSKASGFYRNDWCLVDAVEHKQVDLAKIKQEDLPEELRGKTVEELAKYLGAKLAERRRIQKRIQEIHRQRQEYISAEMAKRALTDDQSFDAAVRQAIREQATRKGYVFESK